MTISLRADAGGTSGAVQINGADQLVLTSTGAMGSPVITGLSRALKLSSTGLNSLVSVTADELVVSNGSGLFKWLTSVSLSLSTASTGANGLDTGTIATSTWYSVWVIWNGSTVSGLLSASATSPTLPNGYTFKARVGWIRTDGTANKYPLGFIQHDRYANYAPTIGSNTGKFPVMASGAFGDINTPTYTSIAVGAFAPPTATAVQLVAYLQVGASSTLAVGPSAQFSSYAAALNRPPLVASVGGSGGFADQGWIRLESSNIWACSDGAGNYLAIYGWEDAL